LHYIGFYHRGWSFVICAPPSISVLFFLYEGELIKYLEWSCWTATRCGRRF